MRFPGKGVMLALILSILMVPSQVYLIPQYQIIQQLGWPNTIHGIVAPGIFSAFGTFLMISPGVMMAAALMAMAPVLIIFVLLQRRVVEGIAFSGLK